MGIKELKLQGKVNDPWVSLIFMSVNYGMVIYRSRCGFHIGVFFPTSRIT